MPHELFIPYDQLKGNPQYQRLLAAHVSRAKVAWEPQPPERLRTVFAYCQVCGHIEWMSQNFDDTAPGIELQARMGACERCEVVHQRAPEVVAWVHAVLTTHGHDLSTLPPLERIR